jgi:type VI secretion system ImpM family protein
MLGSIRQNTQWRWTAVGKHPAAADYVRLSDGTALLDAVADWVAKGYDALLRNDGRPNSAHSWRFWLRGIKKGALICGLGCDSSDSLGRPFPFLVMGEGGLKHWERQWPWLTAGLEKTWTRMEYIASHRYDDVSALTQDLDTIAAPDGTMLFEAPSGTACDSAARQEGWDACIETLQRSGRTLIGLHSTPGVQAMHSVAAAHARLKECCKEVPRAVFLGGTPQLSYLAVIQHPLSSDDFLALWRV